MMHTQHQPHALARASDPGTSHLAAHMATELASRHRRMVQEALKPPGIELGAEQIAATCGLVAYQVRKRLPELKAEGLVELTGAERKTDSGRRERLWRLTTKTTA